MTMGIPEILLFAAIGVLWAPLAFVAVYRFRRNATGKGAMGATPNYIFPCSHTSSGDLRCRVGCWGPVAASTTW